MSTIMLEIRKDPPTLAEHISVTTELLDAIDWAKTEKDLENLGSEVGSALVGEFAPRFDVAREAAERLAVHADGGTVDEFNAEVFAWAMLGSVTAAEAAVDMNGLTIAPELESAVPQIDFSGAFSNDPFQVTGQGYLPLAHGPFNVKGVEL